METGALQEQFHIIQEQQKRRFKQRTKSCPKPVPTSFGDVVPNKEHYIDDLDLKTATQFEVDMLHSSHHTHGIPRATNTEAIETNCSDVHYLQTRVEEIQLENAQLKSRLKQTEAKLTEINQIREKERQALGSTSTTATQRIVELSKRNRELNAEIASERNNVRQLQKKLKESESKQISLSKSAHIEIESSKGDPTLQENVQLAMIEQLKERLQVSNQKRVEYRNECQVLKQELKLSHKVISKEVGEGANVSSLLNSVSGWRGRSQQIIALQNKVSELQQKVVCLSRPTQKWSPGDLSSTVSHVNADSRQISALKKLEDTKKKSLEDSRSELATLQGEHSKLQQQCLALKSRNKTLATELKSLRAKIGTPKHSQENSRGDTRSSQFHPTDTLDTQDRLALEQTNQRLQAHLTKCLSELQSLKRASKNGPCQTNTVLHKEPSATTNARQPRSAPLPPVIPPPGSRGSKRPSLSRKTASAGQYMGTANSVSSFYNDALAQVSQIEKERLAELTFSLQQRLDSTTDKLSRTDSYLRNTRQQIRRLEKQVGRTPGRATKHTPKESGIMSELEAKLEIQKNENEVLRETLDQTRHEKLADMKLFQDMIRETKQLFVDSVKQLYSQQSRRSDDQ